MYGQNYFISIVSIHFLNSGSIGNTPCMYLHTRNNITVILVWKFPYSGSLELKEDKKKTNKQSKQATPTTLQHLHTPINNAMSH